MLKQLVDMYKVGDKIAILYSTTSGRTTMIHEDGYEVEEYHNIMHEKGSINKEKEIIVDYAEHLTRSEARELAQSDAKVILLFDQVGGLNGLTIDQLRALGFVPLVPAENAMRAAGGDAKQIVDTLISKAIARITGHILNKAKTKVVSASKLKNPVVISNNYDETVIAAIEDKSMSAIAKLSSCLDGIGKKTSAEIGDLVYNEIEKYSQTLKESAQKQIKHMLNAINAKDAYALSKLTGKQITLKDALFGKAIGLPGANARRQPDMAFIHTFDEVLVDLARYDYDADPEIDASYATRLYYAVTRATGSVAFSSNVDDSIIKISKKVVKA